MLSDELRTAVSEEADRRWPHVEGGDADLNSARAARRLSFRQGVEWSVDAWSDRHGDVWRLGSDGLMHSYETAPFPREHVEKKWGPLVPHPDRENGDR